MGTINYGTSELLTVGVNVNDYDSCEPWELEDLHDVISDILDNYNFYHYHVALKCGYYEGFYINIEYQDYCYFDDYKEKQETLKELSNIRRMLKECINNGLVACWPGWCTGYSNTKDSLQELKQAISNAKASVKATPTERDYYRRTA